VVLRVAHTPSATLAALRWCSELDLSSNSITSLPPDLSALRSLTKLDLSRNPLRSV
jgi:Leucine-rich repeat (LRR) protein